MLIKTIKITSVSNYYLKNIIGQRFKTKNLISERSEKRVGVRDVGSL